MHRVKTAKVEQVQTSNTKIFKKASRQGGWQVGKLAYRRAGGMQAGRLASGQVDGQAATRAEAAVSRKSLHHRLSGSWSTLTKLPYSP